ncbi:hypothetical protein DCC85_03640 [Paenibacillus sp. CAA11]|uniref:DUF1129 family protein n=1 Tax=Paenibacillus sp. CAA11 TaxID=1532905 RepID=UPI000D39C8A1|nr:DUF1129 family protein [Paenibacillus sp. CAA11]AWB43402.1 hypothetical protein DCC85_03640 [Paenibacillus sp. CAA11]
MYIHEMIRETNLLRENMSPDNEAFFSEIALYIRSSSLTEAKGEEVLLETARQMMKLQDKGRPVQEVFGTDPAAYGEQLVADLSIRKPRTLKDKISYYIMIPWVALTWVFFIYMLTGFFSKWFGGELEYTRIGTSTLLLIALGAIVLVELLTRFLKPEAKQEAQDSQGREKLSPRTLGIYLGIALGIIALFLLLGALLPAFTVSPWDSLVIFIVGLIGQRLLFFHKSKIS